MESIERLGSDDKVGTCLDCRPDCHANQRRHSKRGPEQRSEPGDGPAHSVHLVGCKLGSSCGRHLGTPGRHTAGVVRGRLEDLDEPIVRVHIVEAVSPNQVVAVEPGREVGVGGLEVNELDSVWSGGDEKECRELRVS